MSSNITRGKILKRGNTVRVSMLKLGPLVRSNYDTALKNDTNLRGEVDPVEDRFPGYFLTFLSAIFDVSPAILDFFRLFLTYPRLF